MSKKLINLLRHGSLPRENDGAIDFWRTKDYLQNHFVYCQHWSDEKLKSVLASTASESLENAESESQNVPLSSLNVQQTSTGRPVMVASSSNCSEWNNDDKWSSQEWTSGEMLNTSTGRPANDKFVIDDDMDSDTAAVSNLSQKMLLNRSPEDSMQDIDKRSIIW